MNFAYDPSGTAQQIQWAQDAIAACTYPLGNVNVNVTFFWVSALPSTVHGLLMLTQMQGDGSAKIFINNRADDPNASHLVGGLDNPAGEIHNFYMESVIHELGHVTHFTLLGSDTSKEDVVCGTLEIPQPLPTNGYRVGDHTDYAQDPPTILWADSVKEGIAEVFKDMTYAQRVYDNRSNWKLRGTDQVAVFGQGLSSATTSSRWFDDFTGYSNLATKYQNFSGGLAADTSVSGGDAILTLVEGEEGQTAWFEDAVELLTPSIASVRIDDLKISHGSSTIPSVLGSIQTPANYVHLSLFNNNISSFGGDVYVCQLVPGIFQVTRGALPPPRVPLGLPDSPYAAMTYPFWLVMRRDLAGLVTGELWQTDPALGGAAVVTTSPTVSGDGVANGIYFEFQGWDDIGSGNIGEAIKITDLLYESQVPAVEWTPGWPYADSQVALGDHNSAILRMKNQIASSKLALTTR